MKQAPWILAVGLAIAASGCSEATRQPQQKIPTSSASFPASAPTSTVIAAANGFVRQSGLNWGDPVEVRWQDGSPPDNSGSWIRHGTGEPPNRWLVLYPIPDSERWLGHRGVHVETNGHVWFVPQE